MAAPILVQGFGNKLQPRFGGKLQPTLQKMQAPLRRDRLLVLCAFLSDEKAAEIRHALERNYRIRIRYSPLKLKLVQQLRRWQDLAAEPSLPGGSQ